MNRDLEDFHRARKLVEGTQSIPTECLIQAINESRFSGVAKAEYIHGREDQEMEIIKNLANILREHKPYKNAVEYTSPDVCGLCGRSSCRGGCFK